MAVHLHHIYRHNSPPRGRKAKAVQNGPIVRLYDELLLEIFALCTPETHFLGPMGQQWTPSGHTLDVDAHPWALTRVCRRWCSLASSYPVLWSTIVFPPCPSPFQIRLALIQLHRSAQRPLSFHLDTCSFGDGQELLSALFRHGHRWKSVQLPHISETIGVVAPSFPLLENLSCYTETFASNLPPLGHHSFPRLQFLSLFESSTQFNTPAPSNFEPEFCPQLTHLTLKQLEYHEFLPLLSECAPYLRYLELSGVGTTHWTTPVTFPRLRALRLDNVCSQAIENLHCPSVKEMTILGGIFGTQSFPSISPEGFTSLEVLWSPHSNALPEFLLLCGQLTSLHVHLHYPGLIAEDQYGVERLMSLLSGPTVCPLLNTIIVEGLTRNPRAVPQLVSFFRLVRRRGSGLQRARLAARDFQIPRSRLAEFNSRCCVENHEVRGQLRDTVSKLRLEHPHLDLTVECQLYKSSEKLFVIWDQHEAYIDDVEQW